jgi:hypothetical protein
MAFCRPKEPCIPKKRKPLFKPVVVFEGDEAAGPGIRDYLLGFEPWRGAADIADEEVRVVRKILETETKNLIDQTPAYIRCAKFSGFEGCPC